MSPLFKNALRGLGFGIAVAVTMDGKVRIKDYVGYVTRGIESEDLIIIHPAALELKALRL